MVACSINLLIVHTRFVNYSCSGFARAIICVSPDMIAMGKFENIRCGVEKLKEFSIFITNLFVNTLSYWLGISLSFLLWKLSTILKKENKESYWLEPEEEEDYKSQY